MLPLSLSLSVSLQGTPSKVLFNCGARRRRRRRRRRKRRRRKRRRRRRCWRRRRGRTRTTTGRRRMRRRRTRRRMRKVEEDGRTVKGAGLGTVPLFSLPFSFGGCARIT